MRASRGSLDEHAPILEPVRKRLYCWKRLFVLSYSYEKLHRVVFSANKVKRLARQTKSSLLLESRTHVVKLALVRFTHYYAWIMNNTEQFLDTRLTHFAHCVSPPSQHNPVSAALLHTLQTTVD